MRILPLASLAADDKLIPFHLGYNSTNYKAFIFLAIAQNTDQHMLKQRIMILLWISVFKARTMYACTYADVRLGKPKPIWNQI